MNKLNPIEDNIIEKDHSKISLLNTSDSADEG